MSAQTCTAVRVGDWVVARAGRDTDYGVVQALLHDDTWQIGWSTCVATPLDVSDETVDVYESKEAAAEACAEALRLEGHLPGERDD